MNRGLKVVGVLAAVVVAAASGLARAAQDVVENNALADLKKAKASIVQAIGVAETHAAGPAFVLGAREHRGPVSAQGDASSQRNEAPMRYVPSSRRKGASAAACAALTASAPECSVARIATPEAASPRCAVSRSGYCH